MSEQQEFVMRPGAFARGLNQFMGTLVGWGLGPEYMRVLAVRGRKSGKLYSLPVDLLARDGSLYLVAPRGHTEWSKNAAAAGEVTLKRGRHAERYRVRALSGAEKPPILKAYLDAFRRDVQGFFPVPAGSPVEAFGALTDRYPAFALERARS